jgi:hypothetical protein
MFRTKFVYATLIAAASIAAACNQSDPSSPTSPTSREESSTSLTSGLTAAQTAELSVACGGFGTGDRITNGTPPTTPPPARTISGPGPGVPEGPGLITGPRTGAPQAGDQVALFGSVEGLGGSCPSLSFSINGKTVRTTGTTSFGRGACADLSAGSRAGAIGTAQADGSVSASCVAAGI